MPEIEIKKFDVMSVAKVLAVIMAIIGFITGLLTAAAGAAAGGMLSMIPGAGAMIGRMTLASIILLPIMGAIYGFVGGAIWAFLYNIVADWIGGINFKH